MSDIEELTRINNLSAEIHKTKQTEFSQKMFLSLRINVPCRLATLMALLFLILAVNKVVSFQYQSRLPSTTRQSSMDLQMVASSTPPKSDPKVDDPWYSTRIQKDMGYSEKVKSLYLRHLLVERMETAELALQWYLQLSSGENVAGNDSEKETVELNTSRDPFGDVAQKLSACSMTRDEGGKIGWVDIPSDDVEDEDDSEARRKNGELTFASLIPDDILEKLVALQPKAGDVHIVGPSASTNQVHVIRIEELYVPNVLPKAIERVYRRDDEGDAKLGSFNGVNEMVPRNKLKGHGVMPRVPKFERRRTGESELEGQQQRTYAIQTNGCQMNVADSERLEGILQDELGLAPIPDGSSKEEINKADVVIFNTCSIRDHAEQKLYDALGPFRARKRQKPDSKNGSNSDFALIVTGCVAQQEGKALLRKIPEIDVVLGPQYVPYLGSVLEQIEWGHQLVVTAPTIIADNYKAAETSTTSSSQVESSSVKSAGSTSANTNDENKAATVEKKSVIPAELLPENDDFSAKPIRGHSVRAWVNVIYGCNEHCTYCV